MGFRTRVAPRQGYTGQTSRELLSSKKARFYLGESLRMSDELSGGSFRRREMGLQQIPSIDRFLFLDPLLCRSFDQKQPSRSTPCPKVFMGLGARERPADRALYCDRIGFLRDRFGNLGQYLLGRNYPAFPPGSFPGGSRFSSGNHISNPIACHLHHLTPLGKPKLLIFRKIPRIALGA